MKKYILLIFIIFVYVNYSKANDTVENTKSVKKMEEIDDFHLGSILKDEESFHQFVAQNLSVLNIKSSTEITAVFADKNIIAFPIFSEFAFQALQNPRAISTFLRIFFNTRAFIFFSIGIIFSIILSHYLGEFKFRFKALSFWRVSYSFFRFASVNAFRVWLFVFLFSDNIKPLTKVYMTSVYNVADQQPLLFKVTSLFASLM